MTRNWDCPGQIGTLDLFGLTTEMSLLHRGEVQHGTGGMERMEGTYAG